MEPMAASPTSDGPGSRDTRGPRSIGIAKLSALLGFLVLLSASYYLRTEVLELNRIRFSADEARAEYELKRLQVTYPEWIERHKVELKNYELQMEHHEKLSELYRKDLVKYLETVKNQSQPPQMPIWPQPPEPPEVQEKLSRINLEFRTRKARDFVMTSRLNWAAWIAALALTGGLLSLLLFDRAGPRLLYLAVLLLSFVFL